MAIIEVDGLTKSYGEHRAVDGVSFSVEQGEIFGIVGPNGAGKTTIVESIEGLRQPDSGTIRVFGMEPITDRYEIAQRLGAQLQESRLQEKAKVGELLDTYASFYRSPANWRELAKRFGLEGKEGSYYGSLSGGQKQRVSAVLALVGSPEVAVLDELTTGLDPAARRSTWETVEQMRDSGVTVVLVTHFMDEAARLCDRIMVLVEGEAVATDTPGGLIERAGLGQTLRFRPSAPLPDGLFAGIPGVVEVSRDGSQVAVSGSGDFASSVVLAVAQAGAVAQDLQIDRADLEDAYLELTGSVPGTSASEEELV